MTVSAEAFLSQRRVEHVIEVCPQFRGINGRQALPSLQQQRRLQRAPRQRAQLSDRVTVPRDRREAPLICLTTAARDWHIVASPDAARYRRLNEHSAKVQPPGWTLGS